jgi:hypothetical protein
LKMKRLLMVSIIIAMLAVCAPSNAYILVYKLGSTIKTVETDANLMMNFKINGYMALDINDVEETVADSLMVIYGKDVNTTNMYYIEDFSHGSTKIHWTEEGAYVTFEMENPFSIFDYDLRLTGKLKEKNVGFGSDANELRSAASSLSGSMIATHGKFFDDIQSFFGSGSAKMTLDTKKTYAANATPLTIDQIITAIVEDENGLIDKDYQLFVLP